MPSALGAEQFCENGQIFTDGTRQGNQLDSSQTFSVPRVQRLPLVSTQQIGENRFPTAIFPLPSQGWLVK
jgi:hypothetical protein